MEDIVVLTGLSPLSSLGLDSDGGLNVEDSLDDGLYSLPPPLSVFSVNKNNARQVDSLHFFTAERGICVQPIGGVLASSS